MSIHHSRLRRNRAADKLWKEKECQRKIDTTLENIAGNILHVNSAVNSWAGFTSAINTEIIRLRQEVSRATADRNAKEVGGE